MRNILSLALVVASGGACSSSPGAAGVMSAGSSVSAMNGATGAATGTTGASGAASGGTTGTTGGNATSTGTATAGVSTMSGSGASDTSGASGGSDGGIPDATAGGGPEGGTAGATMSPGCGMSLPANVMLGQFTDMADPGNGNPPPIMVDNVARGYWLYVPPSYDKSKPYKVIYQGAGCGISYPNGSGQSNKSGTGNGSQPVWPFQSVDMGEAIQVGIDYGYNPARTNCFDDSNPNSNDFMFFPVLKGIVENMLCVDPSHEYFSGHSSGSWMTNQMTCAFGNEIRGIAISTGNEPSPPCLNEVKGAHIASLFLHDVNDQLNSYAGILPAVLRALNNNGCTMTGGAQYALTDVQQALPSNNPAMTTPWPIPQGLTIPGNGQCIQFNGCPVADSPVVFCTTTNADPGGQNHYEFVNSFIAPLFWHLFSQF